MDEKAFEELQKKSEECTRIILFDLLDKKKTIAESASKIEECKQIIKQFKAELFHKYDYKEEDYEHLFNKK